jgi:hypothetical protein
MLYEYAVEPQAIGSSWETFRYVIEKFGFDKGRLISEFPKKWFREVYDATTGLPPMQKKRVEEALNQARKNKVVRCHRTYDGDAGDWLYNALTENRRSPFHVIIAAENPDSEPVVLLADDLDELQPLMNVPPDCTVQRDAASLAAAMKEMLRFSSRILFVDPFYDPFSSKYKSTLRECLKIVKAENNNAVCEIHYRHHNDKPGQDVLERESVNLFRSVIPEGMTIRIYCWRQKEGGADFHARYLLTDKGGIGVDAGFSAEGNHQTTDMHLMSFDLSQEKIKALARYAAVYELIEPVLQVASDGHVKHV